MGFWFWIAIIWIVLIAILIWGVKGQVIKRTVKEKKVADAKSRHKYITVKSNNLVTENSFTELLRKTFTDRFWVIRPQKKSAEFRAENPLGNIIGLTVYCTFQRDGQEVLKFNHAITELKDQGYIHIKEGESDWFGLKEQLGLSGNHEYRIEIDSYEFSIPDNNPLYYNNNVRDAVGMERVKEAVTPLEEFVAISKTLPEDFREHTDAIQANLTKALSLTKDNERGRGIVAQFIERYIPLINDVMRNCEPGNSGNKTNDKTMETLKMLSIGTEHLISKISEKGDMDAAVAQTLIEQSLIREGLFDPMNDMKDIDLLTPKDAK